MRRHDRRDFIRTGFGVLSLVHRKPIWAIYMAFGAALFATSAVSQGLLGGGVSATANFTLSHGLTFRASERDESLNSFNGDNGDLNYGKGNPVSNTSNLTAEFEFTNGDLGLFARLNGFHDFETMDGERERTELSDDALDVAGRDFRLLDLYASGYFEPGGIPLDIRVGNQVLNWGESTFVPNGINVINPIDVSRLRTPGSELRDALVPVPMVYVAAEVVPNLSVEGFYQSGWKNTEIDPSGTYFSTTDYVGKGGTHAFLSGRAPSDLGANPLPEGLGDAINGWITSASVTCEESPGINANCTRDGHDPYFLSVERDADREPADDGQYGLALRFLSEALNDTEFGLYYVNAHSRLPLVGGRVAEAADLMAGAAIGGAIGTGFQTAAGADPSLAPFADAVTALAGALTLDRFAKASGYFVEYPENLKTLGLSFNTLIGASGWALQGEYSFHPDLPLQRTEESVLMEALVPVGCLAAQTDPTICFGLPVLGNDVQGYVRRNVSQVQVTATQVFGPALGSDAVGFITEAAFMKVHGMPDSSDQPLETGGSSNDDTADDTSWGYRGAVWLDYSNAIGAAKLTPYIQFQHDVSGSSPSPFGPFVDGRKSMTLGVGASYLERWSADVSYTSHSGSNNSLAGRDFMSVSFSYSF